MWFAIIFYNSVVCLHFLDVARWDTDVFNFEVAQFIYILFLLLFVFLMPYLRNCGLIQSQKIYPCVSF